MSGTCPINNFFYIFKNMPIFNIHTEFNSIKHCQSMLGQIFALIELNGPIQYYE